MYAFFERLIQPFPSNDGDHHNKPPPKNLLGFCLHYSEGSKRYLLLLAFLSASVALMEVSLFAFLGQLVDWLNDYTPETFIDNAGHKLAFWSVLILVIMPITILLRSVLVHQTLLGNFPMAIRWLTHKYLLGQSIEYYQNEFAGRLSTKVMQTALAVRDSAMKVLDVMLYVCVYFGGVIFLVASLDWRLSLPFLVWLFVYCCLLKFFLPRLQAVSSKQADARSDMTGRIVDTYTNISTVKLFSHSARETSYAKKGMEKFLYTVYPQMRLATSLSFGVWICNALLTFGVTALSIYLWLQSDISTGAIAAAIGVILRLHGMSQWIMWEVSALFENLGTVHDGMNTLTAKRFVQDSTDAKTLEFKQGDVEFKNVFFNYGKGSGLLEDFSVHIKAGEKIGLIGRSGAGKSTLVNLLLRFYDLQKGKILIDGQDISELKQESLRDHIGMVSQDTSLLHRSVRENILYGRPSANENELLSASKKAEAHQFILDLEDATGQHAYDTKVGERGVKLSGGQRQRIAIARVLLKNAPILILDEATSALDSEVELAIQENLRALMENKTVIAIAHRLSTIAALDRLIVIDEGKIIEQGTHQELLDKNGAYAQLWKHQSGGFL